MYVYTDQFMNRKVSKIVSCLYNIGTHEMNELAFPDLHNFK